MHELNRKTHVGSNTDAMCVLV